MFSILFLILTIVVFGQLIILAFKAAWGITKILCSFVLLPVIVIALVLGGLMYVALPVLLIVGAASLISSQS